MFRKSYKALIVLFISFIIGINSCSPEIRYKVLTTLFDGVPPPVSSSEISDSVSQVDLTSDSLITEKANKQIKITIKHYPYSERECDECHNSGSMGKLVLDPPALCYKCHDDMAHEMISVHGPVKGGFCTACHSPHESNNSYLLHQNESQLCITCHDLTDIVQNRVHKQVEEQKCQSCHDPHASEKNMLLEEGVCLECHSDFAEKYTRLHGPILSNSCETCHEGHLSDKKFQLTREGKDLCLYCHMENDVYSSRTHIGYEKLSCLMCHNPHGENNKNFLLNVTDQ